MSTLSALTGPLTHYGPGPYGGGPGWWVVFPILWFLLVATFLVFLIRGARRWRGHAAGPWGAGPWGPGPGGPGPWGRGAWEGSTQAGERTLAERFAAGEIDEAEYTARLETLRRNTGSRPPAD